MVWHDGILMKNQKKNHEIFCLVVPTLPKYKLTHNSLSHPAHSEGTSCKNDKTETSSYQAFPSPLNLLLVAFYQKPHQTMIIPPPLSPPDHPTYPSKFSPLLSPPTCPKTHHRLHPVYPPQYTIHTRPIHHIKPSKLHLQLPFRIR